MKNNSPQKQAAISWIILMIGILLAVIGAMTAKEYRVNLCLLIGAMVVVGGIVYHLTMMKCPYCGCSLVGYRPIPTKKMQNLLLISFIPCKIRVYQGEHLSIKNGSETNDDHCTDHGKDDRLF